MSFLRKLPTYRPNPQSILKSLTARFYSAVPDVPTSAYYDEQINTAAQSDDLEALPFLFNKRRRDGCFPTSNTFKFITDTEFCRSNLISLVQILARIDRGLARRTAFEALIARLCKINWIEEAMQMVDSMAIVRCRLTAVSFYPILNALTKKGKVEEALRVVDRMRDLGVPPDRTAYGFLLTSYCYSGDLTAASEVMGRIEEEGLGTDPHIHDALIFGACKAGKVEGALMLLRRMMDEGFHVKYSTHGHVIKALLKLKYYDQAVRFAMIFAGKDDQLDTESLGVLASKLIARKRFDEAKVVLEEMGKRNLNMGTKLSNFYEEKCKK